MVPVSQACHERKKEQRDSSLRRPTLSQERKRKKKSACSVRNDGWVGPRRRGQTESPPPKGHGVGHFLLGMVSNFLKCVRSQADGRESNLPKRVQEKTS